MCGIAGSSPPRPQPVTAMLAAMAHRGPDDRGLLVRDDAALGHARLSIIDLAGGRQPLGNEDGSVQLTFNGEIYNFRELRKELEASGHRFRTQTDSEVIVHLYEDHGPDCVRRLYGMFAFALATPEGLMLARDPLGIKPLYTGRAADGTLLFASEMRALLPHVQTIEAFPPGHYWTPATGLVRYYDLPPIREDLTDPAETTRLLTRRLRRAVERRLVADVPVGVFLSGGLDSSLIAAFAAQAHRGGPLHSFAVGLKGSDDLERARQVAAHLGTEHHEYIFERDELLALLPGVIARLESFDPALVRSALPAFLVSRLARRYVKVVLSGEGADELFAGYQYLKRPEFRRDLQQELQAITRELHHTNLQRVDRMSMAHGLEARVPFLSTTLLEVAWRIPAEHKLHPSGVEKWILREVARPLLPAAIADRAKAKFAIGTGVGPTLEAYAEAVIPDDEFAAEAEAYARHGIDLATKEACLYFRHFRQAFGEHTLRAARLVGQSRSLNPDQLYGSAARRGA